MIRRATLIVTSLLMGCGSAAPSASDGDGRDIACGPTGGALDQRCRLEAVDDKGTLRLVLRQPEGGFRRLVWPKGGNLMAADGAEPLATRTLPGGGVEARIGKWSYRIEAKGGGRP